jgi:hypothetical protein
MKPLPLPLRVAAGLAVSTAERVRELPKQLTGLPITVVSQLLQCSMRVQQHVTELAIKGDDALSALRPVEDTPSWATFDEDVESKASSRGPSSGGPSSTAPLSTEPSSTAPSSPGPSPTEPSPTEPSATSAMRDTTPISPAAVPEPRTETNGQGQFFHELDSREPESDPWAEEERALAEEHEEGEFDSTGSAAKSGPAGVANYDELTLPQLRARLRRFSLAELEELLTYERTHADRASFVGMLARRIGNVSKAAQDPQGNGEGSTSK